MRKTEYNDSRRFPKALKPIYPTTLPNKSIRIFEGDIELKLASGAVISNPATIEWRWFPSPSIRFDCLGADHYPEPSDLSEGELHIPTIALKCKCLISRARLGEEGTNLSGRLTTPAVIGESQECDRVIFHLGNFASFLGDVIYEKPGSSRRGRLHLETSEWSIDLDQRSTIETLTRNLKNEGGYAVTHVGMLRRLDGREFTSDEASSVLRALYFFFSFMRGLWCGPILSVGLKDDVKSWREWRALRLTPWKGVQSWFPTLASPDNLAKLSQAFRGFMQKWCSDLWQDPIKQAIHWYVESNIGAGSIEGSIILLQAALELISWVYFVDDPNSRDFSTKQWKKKRASIKIRQLLAAFAIPVDIPISLESLESEAAALQASDGPEAFVRLRNAIVHGRKSKRNMISSIPFEARIEVWKLGIWYLELAILRIFEYNGVYFQRFRSGFPDDVRTKVPWASSD